MPFWVVSVAKLRGYLPSARGQVSPWRLCPAGIGEHLGDRAGRGVALTQQAARFPVWRPVAGWPVASEAAALSADVAALGGSEPARRPQGVLRGAMASQGFFPGRVLWGHSGVALP